MKIYKTLIEVDWIMKNSVFEYRNKKAMFQWEEITKLTELISLVGISCKTIFQEVKLLQTWTTAWFDDLYLTLEYYLNCGTTVAERNKMIDLISSFIGKKQKPKTTIDLTWFKIKDWYRRTLYDRINELDLDLWRKVDAKFVEDVILWNILRLWKQYWWYKPDMNWKFTMTNELNNLIDWKLNKMINWMKANNRTIKNFTQTIDQWFWTTNIYR